MPWNPDFREFFRSLNDRGVEYLLIGGGAYNYYAPPRATKDLDVWVRPTEANLRALRDALTAFGFRADDLDLARMATDSSVLVLGRAPNRIDILTHPSGVDWTVAWSRRGSAAYDQVPVPLIGLEDLILAKRAAGRPRDLADAAALEEIARRQPPPR